MIRRSWTEHASRTRNFTRRAHRKSNPTYSALPLSRFSKYWKRNGLSGKNGKLFSRQGTWRAGARRLLSIGLVENPTLSDPYAMVLFMSKLTSDERTKVLKQLLEGSSVSSTVRLTAISMPTILRLLVDVGEVCAEAHDRLVRGVGLAACKPTRYGPTWA